MMEISARVKSQSFNRGNTSAKLKNQRKALKYASLPELDDRIKTLEYDLQTSMLSLSTEKKYVAELKVLNSQREDVKKI